MDIFAETKTELIDGKIIMMSPRPRISHNRACTAISREFSSYLKGKSCEAFSDGVDVFLDEKNRFVPDVMIVCNHNIIQDDGIHGAPDLVVEVLSTTTARFDRGRKKDAYEKAEINALPKNGRNKVEIYDKIKVSLYNDLIIKLDDIFERIR